MRRKLSVSLRDIIGKLQLIFLLDFLAKCPDNSTCQVHPCHDLYGLHREKGYLTPEIAIPLCECYTGCDCKQVKIDLL